jgi:hypothetical protein
MADDKSQWQCDLNECGLFLERPITLPCGFTICKNHLETFSDIYRCKMCLEEHPIPQQGFQINKKLMKQLESKAHLSGLHKQTENALENLEEIAENCDKMCLNDPESFIFDYFFNIRNKIDQHRESCTTKINEKSSKLIEILRNLENDCKKNISKSEKIDLDRINSILFKIKHDLRKPNLSQNELKKHFDEILSNIIRFKDKKEDQENRLLMNQLIEFEPVDNTEFGELVVKNKLKQSTDYCRNLIFSLDRDSNSTKIKPSAKLKQKKNKKDEFQTLVRNSFDFEEMIQKINDSSCEKEESFTEKYFYDKNISFYDSISREDNGKQFLKSFNYKKERKLNAETFGIGRKRQK